MSTATPYVELRAHSCYSLCDGASTPEALAFRTSDLGMPALTLTDHDTLAGAVPFVTAARAAGIQPILGTELTLADDTHLTLLVQDAAGWPNLCNALSDPERLIG